MNKVVALTVVLLIFLTACDGTETELMSPTPTTITVLEKTMETELPTMTVTGERTPRALKSEERFLPDSILRMGCVTGNDTQTIVQFDRDTIVFTDGVGEEKYIDLTEQQIVELSYLYNTITDYTNLSWLDTTAANTVVQKDGKEYEFCDIYTTQVELEQMLCYLNCLYQDVEYDWSVMSTSDVFPSAEEERIGYPPPVE